jgi:hypothetical protein
MARRAGRPTTNTPAGQKVTLSIRTTAGMKSRLADAAEAEGRNLSEEAERRLEDSFGRIENLFGGPKGFALAKMLFASFVFAGERAATEGAAAGTARKGTARKGRASPNIATGAPSRDLPSWAWLNDNDRLQAALSGLFRAIWALQEGATLDDLQKWLDREFRFARPASGFVPSEGQSRDAATLVQGEKPKCSP